MEILIGRRRTIYNCERMLKDRLPALIDTLSDLIMATKDPNCAAPFGQLANAYASLIGATYAGILHQRIGLPYYEESAHLLSPDDVQAIVTKFPELQPQLSLCLDLDQTLRALVGTAQ